MENSENPYTTTQITSFRETLFGSLGLVFLLIHLVFLFLHGAKGLSLFQYSSIGVFIMTLFLPWGLGSLSAKWKRLTRRQRLMPFLVITLMFLMTIGFLLTSEEQHFSPLGLRHFFVEDMGLKRRITSCCQLSILQQWMTVTMANHPINQEPGVDFMIDDIPLERLPTGMTCQFETVLLLYDTSQKASFLLLGWDDVYFQGIIGTQAGADFSQFPGYPWTQQWQKGIYGYHDIR